MIRPGPRDLATADGHDRYVPSATKDIMSAGHEGVYEWAVANLVVGGTAFLDLGCGTGYGAALVVDAGGSFDGVDGSAAAIEYAEAHYGRPSARFFVADVTGPLPPALVPGSYDVVFSSEVLEHVVDPFAFTEVMARYLRPDGTCFVGTPNRLWSRENLPEGRLFSRSHVMEFTPPALVALLRTVFDDVVLMFRLFPVGAIPATVQAGRARVARAAEAAARELVPEGLRGYGRRLVARRRASEWSPADIEWTAADASAVDPRRAAGLVAVCRGPRR
jgi:SAM-dependent methyltransferase